MSKAAASAVLVIALLVLGACGSGDRPSVDELEDAILSGESGIGVSKDQAPCTAEVLHSSSLSDEMLRSYITNEDHELSDDERVEFQAVLDRLESECGFQQGAG